MDPIGYAVATRSLTQMQITRARDETEDALSAYQAPVTQDEAIAKGQMSTHEVERELVARVQAELLEGDYALGMPLLKLARPERTYFTMNDSLPKIKSIEVMSIPSAWGFR